MRRTIAQSALVFASVLLIIALAGCGGGKKTPVAMSGGDGDNGGGGGMVPEPPAAVSITLPSGSMLRGTTNVAAGMSTPIPGTYSKGRISAIMCPSAAGDAGCVVTVTAAGATATGGAQVVPGPTNQMVWQANNGPGETSSDGGHANSLVTKLGASGVRDKPVTAGTAGADVVQSSIAVAGAVVEATATPTVVWTKGTAPTIDLTMGLSAFGSPYTSDSDSEVLGTDPGKLSRITSRGEEVTGWRTPVALSKTLPGGQTLHAVVYSDIDRPTNSKPAVSFARGEDLSGVSAISTALGRSTTTALTFEIGGNRVTVPSRDWSVPQNASITGVTVTYTDNNGDEQTRSDARMTCTALVCRAAGGQLQGTWNIAAQETTGTQDPNFLTLGSWVALPTNPSGTFEWGAFADGTGFRFPRSDLNSSRETYKYRGPALGLYATGTYPTTATGSVTGGTVGSFAATANLTATFGPGTTSTTGVVGSVTDFKENNVSLGAWSVSLQDTNTATLDGLFTGDTEGVADGRTMTGEWGVQFFQSNHPDRAGTGYATGTFSASTGIATSNTGEGLHIIGAFGAERQAATN